VSYGSPPPGNHNPYGGNNPYGQPSYGGAPYGGPTAGDPGTLDLPWYGIGFAGAVKRTFQKYARFDGRASRSEFWWSYLAYVLAFCVLYVPVAIGAVTESTGLVVVGALLFLVFILATFVPILALSVRRLHDANFSGWLYLISLVPCGSFVLLVLWCLPPKPEGARYDKPGVGGQGYGQQGYGQYGQQGYGGGHHPYGQ
ncbi:DUF805 domain-containing protein, partial [Nocardioides sp. J9]|uniref:DUF805 domain-containing protein n=1 Tax=Nocardioides sp. J9 TaxID=935844 RepID=UPI001C984685